MTSFQAVAATCVGAAALAAYSSPPLVLYSLAPDAAGEAPAAARPRERVMVIDRISLPGELDNEDILVRDGAILRRSLRGRWGDRLSSEVGKFLTTRLATSLPAVMVTDSRQIDEPDYGIVIKISRLDLNLAGEAIVIADWQITSKDAAKHILRNYAEEMVQGSSLDDGHVVSLAQAVLGKLADDIKRDTQAQIGP